MKNKILEIIKKGEGLHTEFKLAKDGLPKNLFESVCAFLNREGGYIILGVSDKGKIEGISKEKVNSLKKEFSNLCNNEQKILPVIRLTLEELEINKKIVLYVYVPFSSKVHMTSGRFYDRNEDGDFDISRSTEAVANMFNRKSDISYENKLFPDLTIDDLRRDLIERARKMAWGKNKEHPWKNMSDEELLKSAKLIEVDEDGKECINVAGLLIFGKDDIIFSKLPFYRVDALLRIKDIDRYDDRDYIRTNLIETYDRLMHFMKKHLPDPFYLEKDMRVSVLDIIARELCVNMVIHKEYYDHTVSRLIITKDKIHIENASKSKMSGYINIRNFVPRTKNPIIASFFKEIDLADELGSGIRRLAKYVSIYSNDVPIFKEGDMFVSEVPLTCFEHLKVKEEDIVPIEITSKYENIILNFCVTAKSGKEIQEYIGIKDRPYFRQNILKPLIDNGKILMIIPDKPNSRNQKYITKS